MKLNRIGKASAAAAALLLLGAVGLDGEISDLAVEYDTASSSVYLSWTPVSSGVLEGNEYLGWSSPEPITAENAGQSPSEVLPGNPSLDGPRNLMEWWIPMPHPSQTLYFAVGIVKGDGQLSISNNAILEGDGGPAPPSGLAAGSATESTLTLTWALPTDGATEIQILYGIHPGVPGTPALPLWTPVAAGTRVVQLPWPGTTYTFAARSRDAEGVESGMTTGLVLGTTLGAGGAPSGDGDDEGGGGGGCGGSAPMGVPVVFFLALLPLLSRPSRLVIGNW